VQDIRDFLERAGLVPPGAGPEFQPLAGGVSSDIWLVRAGASEFCVKQALGRLRVEAEWRVDTARNANEVKWLLEVAKLNADLVPAVLAADSSIGAFAMEYLRPDRYELWKSQLARGCVIPETGATVGAALAAIHGTFAKAPAASAEFDTDALFYALRLEPYLVATARVHPDLASVLHALVDQTARTKRTVVHGDISPKNILLPLSSRSGGAAEADGPVFLDAECAWFGDPAFDLAFCLNHLLLKTLWVPAVERELLASYDALCHAYLRGVDWEPAAALEQRAAHLLPGLFLARIDGKSPVEYLTDDGSKDRVRRAARSMLLHPVDRLSDIRQAWASRSSDVRRWSGNRRGDLIDTVIGRRVWDSRGRPTVEAEIVLANGIRGRAIAPAGASTGCHEAVDLRDGGSAYGGLGVDRAVRHVSTDIGNAIRGLSALDQEAIDRTLIDLDGTPNKARLGGNAIVAVSMAVLHAAAACREMPLWRHLLAGAEPLLPMPMVQIFGGGAHAGRRVDIQDFLVVPIGANTFGEAISIAVRIYEAAGRLMTERGGLRGVADEGGWWPEFSSNSNALDTLSLAIERADLRPGVDAAIAVDVAASQLHTGSEYVFGSEHRAMSSDELADVLLEWCRRYPLISIEDPLAQDDAAGMRTFTARAGEHVQVIGDDYLVTSAARISAAADAGACNAVLLKPNQVGTITETKAALEAARAAGWSAIVSARSGETEDVTVVHLAVGWAAGQLKVGSCARSERTAKWNEALRIEEALGDRARLGRLPIRKMLWRG
jgi:enolase